MNKLILACMLFLMSISIYAQKSHDQNRGDRLVRTLNLTPDQQNQMKVIGERNRTAVQSIRQSDLTKQDKRESLKSHHQNVRTDVSQILSEEQLLQWDAIQLERKQRKQNERKAMQELNLTKDQKKDLKVIQTEHRSAMNSIRTAEVSKEEKKAGRNALKAQSQSDLARVLSPEQLEKFNKIVRERHEKNRGQKR